MTSKRLCIIPARGGSKRVPGKNIREFHGRPMISHPIQAVMESGLFDEVMVSTESGEIAGIAEKCGAKIPFMRSAKNSTDTAPTADVWREVIAEYEKRGRTFETVFSIYPTAALVTADDIRVAVEMLDRNPDWDGIIPLLEYDPPIQRAMQVREGVVESLCPEHNSTRTQDLESRYFDAGQFYLFRVSALKKCQSLRETRRGAMILSAWDVQDIDTEEGWRLAELKYQMRMESLRV